MLNVSHIVGFPLGVNGPLQRALHEAIHVANKKVNVNFLVSQDTIKNKILEKSIPEKYKNVLSVYSLKPLIPSGVVGWRFNNFLPLLQEMHKFVNKKNQQILHVHAPSPVSRALSSSIIKKKSKCPVVLDLHDPWSGTPFSKSPIILLQTHIMRVAINNADLIVTPHRPLFKLINSINHKKPIYLIPNGVDTDSFIQKPRSPKLIQKLDYDFEDKIVAFSGQIIEEKGLDVLVYAAKIIIKKNPNVKFLVIGDGPLRSKIQNMVHQQKVQKYFRFTGFLPIKTFVDYLSLADICVCPYKPMSHYKIMQSETPMKVSQYMSVGKPVIMSRISDENIVSWSGGGILVEPGNPIKLAEKINYLVQDESIRKKMGELGRNYVQHNLSWNIIADKLVNLYKKL